MRSDPADDRVRIEIDPDAEPIAGVIRHGSLPARSFTGWLELIALLESERGPAAGPNVPADPG